MAERARKMPRRPRKRDAVTQTSPKNYITENHRLLAEIDSLRQEVDQLKQRKESESTSGKPKDEVIVVAVADSPQTENIPGKGCSCKGKCSSRVCGCVKKQIGCTAACKCLDSKCQNQESNKENIDSPNVAAQLSSKVEENTKLLSTLNLRKNRCEKIAQRAAGPSNKGVDQAGKFKEGIFSPDTPLSHRQEFSFSKLQLHTPIKFGASKKIASFDPDSSPNDLYHDKRRRARVSSDIKAVEAVDSPVMTVEIAANSNKSLQDVQIPENSDAESEFATIDPMKPTRQLQRTPVSASSHEKRTRLSDLPLLGLLPVKMEPKILISPPKDIDSPQVDWDEHCAQLVPCRLCKRTFYPYRIEKHEASCKKI